MRILESRTMRRVLKVSQYIVLGGEIQIEGPGV